MHAKIVGIGNSAGIIIPSSLLASLHLKRNDPVVISETPDGFEVRRAARPKSFSELLETHYGKPFDEALSRFQAEDDDADIDWGGAVGEEILS